MAARDVYHNNVRAALEKDGWTITDDPLKVQFGARQLYVDLGAERLIAAERQGNQIAVEIKSFLGPSVLNDYHTALGQFLNYRSILKRKEPDRILYLAVPIAIYQDFFTEPFAQVTAAEQGLKLLIFDPKTEVIKQWIESLNTEN